jgi:hypothetical protein
MTRKDAAANIGAPPRSTTMELSFFAEPPPALSYLPRRAMEQAGTERADQMIWPQITKLWRAITRPGCDAQ